MCQVEEVSSTVPCEESRSMALSCVEREQGSQRHCVMWRGSDVSGHCAYTERTRELREDKRDIRLK